VNTGSTRSSARSSSRNAYAGPRKAKEAGAQGGGAEEAGATEMSERTWLLASGCVLALAAFVRLYALGLNPLHHDEGVNGFFLLKLINSGRYEYDPANYHGPTLYYFALPVTRLCRALGMGLSAYAIRGVPVLFGIASVLLILSLRRRLGSVGALAGAALLALSPGAVYMSRYFIHESLFVFFTLAIVVSALRYSERAQPAYLMLMSVSAALLFATKETAMISAGVLLIALGMSALYVRVRKSAAGEMLGGKRAARKKKQARSAQPDVWREVPDRQTALLSLATLALVALMLFLVVYVLFYSSFLTYQKGVSDSLKTFEIWAGTGKKEHVHEWYTYLKWLWQEDAAALYLGALGVALALLRGRNRFAVFAALWAIGIVAAYSLIPYKTPWLVLNFIVPLAVIGGYGVEVVYRRAGADQVLRVFVLALASLTLAFSGYQMIQLNFRHYDDDGYVYPYAHTVREFLPLVDRINSFAASAGTGKETPISITSQDYWPLPWYLQDYTHVGYYAGRIAVLNEPLVIGSEAQEQELEVVLGDRYRRIDSYALRPGVTLLLYGRTDLLERESRQK
jgi:uncharacterized protein (TIGR03663 family)